MKPPRLHVIDEAEIQYRKIAKNALPHKKNAIPNKIWDEIRLLSKTAPRFVFDDEASAHAGRFVREFEMEFLENKDVARPPFKQCYIEYNIDKMLEAIGRRMESDIGSDTDERMGFLIDGDFVRMFICSMKGRCAYYPVDSFMNQHGSSEIVFGSGSHGERIKRLIYTLGSSANVLFTLADNGGLNEKLSPLMEDWADSFTYKPQPGAERLLEDEEFSVGTRGSMRNLFALLYLLNKHRERVSIEREPSKGIVYKGKRRATPAHSLVKISLDNYEKISRSYHIEGHRDGPRRHEVRGFFRHLRNVPTCDHVFPHEPDRFGHYVCDKCGTMRVWVNSHERGDINKGRVSKEYVVTETHKENQNVQG